MGLCECGCGQEVKLGRRFILGHNRRGKSPSEESNRRRSKALKGKSNPKVSLALKGVPKPAGFGEKVSVAQKGVPKPKGGEGLEGYYQSKAGLLRRQKFSFLLRGHRLWKVPWWRLLWRRAAWTLWYRGKYEATN